MTEKVPFIRLLLMFILCQIQALWLLRRVLVEHCGSSEWRRTVGTQLLALIGRLWLETHLWDPALRPHQNVAVAVPLDEEVGKFHSIFLGDNLRFTLATG